MCEHTTVHSYCRAQHSRRTAVLTIFPLSFQTTTTDIIIHKLVYNNDETTQQCINLASVLKFQSQGIGWFYHGH